MEGKLYETINGVKRYILWRKKGAKLTDVCRFCGVRHDHGIDEGHRLAHCNRKVDKFGNMTVVTEVESIPLEDGGILSHKDGYVIREY